MFTGLVADLGRVVSISGAGRGEGGSEAGSGSASERARLRVATVLAGELAEGDSIAVNGVCLTALNPSAEDFEADVITETLQRTSLATLEPGARVNLELPLRSADRLGGHVVQGHVDGIGSVDEHAATGELRVTVAPDLLRYVVEKGSVALDGVSLTVAAVDQRSLTVCLIPETLRATTLGGATRGARINVEVDIMAKHLEKLVAAGVGART